MKSDKALLIIAATSLTLAACSADTSSTTTTATTTTNQATAQTPATQTASSSDADIMRAHGGSGAASMESATQQDAQASGARPMMGTPIDTSAFDAEIARLEKDVKTNPASKATLAQAYLKRAQALTGAQQYRSALGDFRRTLTYEPNNKDAKDMETQILAIFQSLNREAPAPGTEPAPLPFKKQG